MSLILYLLLAALSGLIIGALARLALPGKDPMTVPQTIAVGIGGTLLAALVSYYVFDNHRGPGFLLSLLFAVAIVFAVRKLRERDAAEAGAVGTGGRDL
jgi:uncharacterized membrane protein YeaQ/YmgE (transglycosylase-associated protein family)